MQIMNTVPNCTELFAVCADALSFWKQLIDYLITGVREVRIIFPWICGIRKNGPIFLVAFTAHHTAPVRYVVTLHDLTRVWEFLYSQESKLSSTGKQNNHGIIFLHYASHKATSYKM